MGDMIDFQAPLAGMNSAVSTLDRAAVKIAGIGGDPSSDTLDLSAEMVQLMQARNDFAANANVAKTFDEVQQSLLNILG